MWKLSDNEEVLDDGFNIDSESYLDLGNEVNRIHL